MPAINQNGHKNGRASFSIKVSNSSFPLIYIHLKNKSFFAESVSSLVLMVNVNISNVM